MSVFKLNLVAAAVQADSGAFSDAASAEHAARDRWVKAAKVAVKAGVVLGMLVKGTEKFPNPQFDKDVVSVIRAAIVAGVSASKKGMKFSSPLPSATGADTVNSKMHTWTVSDLLALSKDQLRDIDDDVLKTQRRQFMQLVDGPMMSRLRMHIDKIENPDKVRGKKGEKTDAATPVNEGPLWDRLAALLAECNATCMTWKDEKGSTPKGLIALQESTLEAAAVLGQVIKFLKA
jgi:hypothetical protein